MVFVHHLLLPGKKWALFHNFLFAIIVKNLFDNPVLFKNVEKLFHMDIMTHNRTDVIKIN